MNVLAIGDTHGGTSAICNIAIPQARKKDCPIIMQVGDFGYWEHTDEGRRFLDKVSLHLVRNDLKLYWIDGNHDNHPKLWADYAPAGPEGLCVIRESLYYVPRGTVFNLGHVKCLGLGGACSIDKQWRVDAEKRAYRPGTLWWPTEHLVSSEAEAAIENAADLGPVDIMFSHDCPTGVDIPGIHGAEKWKFPETWTNRDLLRSVFDAVQPRLLIHGHYHTRYTGKLPLQPKVDPTSDVLAWDYCRVDGLGNDGFPGFAVVLDLDSLFVRD